MKGTKSAVFTFIWQFLAVMAGLAILFAMTAYVALWLGNGFAAFFFIAVFLAVIKFFPSAKRTGIPDYKEPIEQGLRCNCRTRYVVFIGGAGRFDDTLAKIAREREGEMGAHFVDACEVHFMQCFDSS